jgi:hypothetical protein
MEEREEKMDQKREVDNRQEDGSGNCEGAHGETLSVLYTRTPVPMSRVTQQACSQLISVLSLP